MTHTAARNLKTETSQSCWQPDTGAVPVSRSDQLTDIMDKHLARAVPLARRRADPFQVLGGIDAKVFKMWFAPKLAEWLQANFRSPEHVAFLFQVRNSTAWNWWNGDNKASGDAVGLVFMCFPDAAAWFFAEWGRQ